MLVTDLLTPLQECIKRTKFWIFKDLNDIKLNRNDKDNENILTQ